MSVNDYVAGRQGSDPDAARLINVLFLLPEPTPTPAVSVHAEIIRFLRPDRVRAIVAVPPSSGGERSVASILPPEVEQLQLHLAPISASSTLERARRAATMAPRTISDLLRLALTIRRRGIDVIHCDEGTRNGFVGLLLARLTGARCLIHFHSQYGDWMSAPSRFSMRHADMIVPVSQWTGTIIEERSEIPCERIVPVLNGIDVERWEPNRHDGGPVRRELGISGEETLIVQVAQLAEWKRQHDLVSAMRTIVARRPGVRVALVGAENIFPGAAGGYETRLRRQIAESGLSDHVLLLGRRSDVPELLTAADVFCLPSSGDPCALANIEAMAMRLPVVTVDHGGGPELVEHGVTGLVGPCDDVERLATNLLELVDQPDRAREMGSRGRQRVLEHLNAQRMADDVESVYRRLLDRS